MVDMTGREAAGSVATVDTMTGREAGREATSVLETKASSAASTLEVTVTASSQTLSVHSAAVQLTRGQHTAQRTPGLRSAGVPHQASAGGQLTTGHHTAERKATEVTETKGSKGENTAVKVGSR